MNLLLFNEEETRRPLPRTDPRAIHLLSVLRREAGGSFDAGMVDGPRGRGTLVRIDPHALELAFAWGAPPPPLPPVTLLVGLPRPQTARDILRDATTLGVARLVFAAAENSEPGYARSTLWRTDEWRRHLLTGAAQAFTTRVPEVVHGVALGTALAALPAGGDRLALDNYEATASLAECGPESGGALVLALGPERGWTARDRGELRAAGFTLAGLGARVLRTETAAIAALTLTLARRGWL